MVADIRSKALAAIRDGRLRVLDAITEEKSLRPDIVRALLQGYQGRYEITFANGVWDCPCDLLVCPHVAAVALVTGWPSAAAKQGRAA